MCIKKKEISKDFEKYKVAVRLAYINMISRLVKSGMSLDDARDEAYKGDVFSSISWEADFLFTELGEVYFIIVMHGIEYAINLGGPIIEGYNFWLKKNKNKSPLYISDEARKEDYKKYLDKTASSKEKE